MSHTSTGQPEALRLADNYAEACFDQGLNQRTTAQEGWCDGCNPDNCVGCGPGAVQARQEGTRQ